MTSPLHQALRAAAAEGLEANARRWLRFIGWSPGDYVEVQVLDMGGDQFVAHAPDPDAYLRLLTQVEGSNRKPQGTYVIANRVKPEVATREPVGEWRLALKGSTTDQDIRDRTALYVDVDVVRKSGTSATEAEVEAACEVASCVYADFVAILGGYDVVAVGHSGNGVAIFVALDRIPESPEVKSLVADTLRAIQAIYETSAVKIDSKVVDAKRLVPAFGTVKRKGSETPERPHRRTTILVPDQVRRLSLGELRRLRDALVARAPAPSAVRPVAPPSVSAVPDDDEEDLELGDLRKCLVSRRKKIAASEYALDREKYRIYGALLDGTALAQPGARSSTINQAASMVAFAIPAGTAWEIAVELLRPAIAAMPCDLGNPCHTGCPDNCIEYWLGVAEKCYERAMDRAFAAHREREEKKRSNELLRGALTQAAEASRTPTITQAVAGHYAAESLPPPPEDTDWMKDLITSADGKYVSCPHNVYEVLAKHPGLRGTMRLNLVTKDIEVHGGIFAGMKPNVLSTKVMNWLHKSCKLKVKRNEVEDQILLVATENEYDPIREYLDALVWDGVPRLDRLFFDYVVARMKNDCGVDVSEHLKRVGAKFMISAVARVYDPGCQVDTMLVLEGTREGEGKTEFIRRLFGKWYINVDKNLEDKDSKMVPASNWGVELGELSATNRSQDELLKSYLTTRIDKLRLPYGRRIEDFPRRCVFIGTTNNPQWLSYGKGRRRYWPVFVEQVNLDLVSEWRDQLWAEAVVRYKKGEKWHLTAEERAEADAEADARVEESVIEAKVRHWWYQKEPDRRPKHVTLITVIEEVLKLQVSDVARMPRLQPDIGIAMARLGFSKSRPMVAGQRIYAWVPGQELLERAAHLRLVKTPEDGLEDIAAAKVEG